MDALPRLCKPGDKEMNDHLTPMPRIHCAQTCTSQVCQITSLNSSGKISTSYLLNKSKRVPHKLALIHLNIQSLKSWNHLLQLREFIRAKDYHIITLSETSLNKSVKNTEVEIEGYKIFRLDRLGKRGGGVCAYIRSPLRAHILKNLSGTSTTWFQQLWLQVQYKKIRSFIICVVYRPPDCQVSCFEDYLKPSSTCALSFNKPIIILGDLNCNLLQTNPDGLSLLSFASEMNLKQLITSPTRITETSISLIDVVMTSTPDLVHESGVINTSISDHFPVYMVLNTKLPKQPPSYITVRSYKNYDPTLFTADLVSKYDTLLQSIFTVNEVNLKLSKFNEALLSTLQIHAPVKTIRVRNRPVPYVTQSIKDLITHRDQLHQQFKLSRDVTDWSSYKNAKQSVKIALKKAEENYVRGEVFAHKNNTASLWKIINRSIPTKDKTIQCYSKASDLIANEFNHFLSQLAQKLQMLQLKLVWIITLIYQFQVFFQHQHLNAPYKKCFNYHLFRVPIINVSLTPCLPTKHQALTK